MHEMRGALGIVRSKEERRHTNIEHIGWHRIVIVRSREN